MNHPPTRPLRDLAEINPRGSRVSPDELVSFVGMADLDEVAARNTAETPRRFDEVSKGYTPFQNGDLLAAKITPCWQNGKVGEAVLTSEQGMGSTEFHVIRPGPDVDRRYLLHFLRTANVRDAGTLRMTGSGGQRRVPAKFMSDLPVPSLPLQEQRRIASILDEADAIRTKHNALLARFVELEHSAFNERFADSDWDSLFLSECATDMTIGLVRPGHATGLDFSHQYMKMDGITSSGHLDRSKFTFTDASPAELARYSIQDGDLLLNTRNSRELVGKTTVFRGETALFNNNLMRLRFDPRLLPDYVHAYLWSPSGQAALERIKSGTTSVFAIYAKDLTNLPIPAPPIAIQREFSASLAAIRTERDHVAKAVEADEELFAALQHRAFRGEL